MSDETITVADVSDGPGGADDLADGTAISLPVVEILTGRGFITGKSGSGKSNTASVVIEKLLDGGYPCLIVDSDGEYYGLKEEYEILHAGADEECDIQVSEEHAEKLAALALEQNVPIILDVSGYLDEDEAAAIIKETARHLFAKEKKLKKPFLMLVEECHEYIPEGAGLDATGKTLIKVGKRGRKHGLGIVGISQRPADVKKDFITQCDWLCWHRLTWDNDTTVVSRILGSEYGDAVEDLDDGEAFLMTDWAESIRRVQFRRKRTFDAGATPGLDDFERPDLKSVSGDLVSELQDITDERKRRESELADLRQELDKKRQRITQLERELEEARDMSEMADKFAQALLQKSEAPYRGGDGHPRARPAGEPDGEAGTVAESRSSPGIGAEIDNGPGYAARGDEPPRSAPEPRRRADDAAASDAAEVDANGAEPAAATADGGATQSVESGRNGGAVGEVESADRTGRHSGREPAGAASEAVPRTESVDISPARSRSGFDRDHDPTAFLADEELVRREAVVAGFVRAVESLEPVTRGMLAAYRDRGRATPTAAHRAAGATGDRRYAYARNKVLRRAGFIDHRTRGEYAYALPALVRRVYGEHAGEQELAEVIAEIERTAGLDGES